MTKAELVDAIQQAMFAIGGHIQVDYYEDGSIARVETNDIEWWLDKTQPEILKKLTND